MPYIAQSRRIDLQVNDGERIEGPGELNYLFTHAILRYMHDHSLNYQLINDVVGALESAKAEFYRRVAAPYEEKKRAENGDVYP